MLNTSLTRILAAALGCVAIAAASISFAQAPPSTTAGPQTDASASAQQQSSTQTSQPAQQPNQPPGAVQSSTEVQTSTSQSGSAQGSNTPGDPDWPSPERYKFTRPGRSDSRSGPGGSLGVSIVGDGQAITITRVHSGTPAQQMGLRSRDRINSVNGQAVGSADEFIAMIRNMNPGDQVELGIVRDENETTIRGNLEPFNRALARQPIVSGDDWTPNSLDSSQTNSLRTTSYEERSRLDRSPSGDIETRLNRVEQQLSQLTRDIAEIRKAIMPNQARSPEQPDAGQPAKPGDATPSAREQTPGQSPPSYLPPSR